MTTPAAPQTGDDTMSLLALLAPPGTGRHRFLGTRAALRKENAQLHRENTRLHRENDDLVCNLMLTAGEVDQAAADYSGALLGKEAAEHRAAEAEARSDRLADENVDLRRQLANATRVGVPAGKDLRDSEAPTIPMPLPVLHGSFEVGKTVVHVTGSPFTEAADRAVERRIQDEMRRAAAGRRT